MEELPQISFTIPIKPVSGKGARAARYRQEAKEFIPEWFSGYANKHRRYSLTVDFHYVGECNGDMDNRLACIFDALTGKVIYDDSQVKHLVCNMVEFSERTATDVSLKEIPRKIPSLD